MKKFYFLFLFALIASISNLYAAEKTVTFDFSTNPGAVSGIKNGEITVSFDKSVGTTPPKWNAKNGGEMRAYAKNTITVSSVKRIKKIEFSFNKGEDKNEITSTPTGFTSPTWTGESESVVFKIGGTSGHRKVKTIEVTYEFEETQCATPTFNLTADATYTDAQTLVITSTTADATIHYTVNGGAEKIGQPAEFTENGRYTVDAWATKDNLTDSGHASITFTIAKKCAAPTFTPAAGFLKLGNAITFTSATADAEVYYQYSYNGGEYNSFVKGTSFTPDKEGTYKIIAKATKTGFEDGVSEEQIYEVGNFVFNELFYESFDKNDGTGGNDNQWSGTIASSNIQYDVAGWTCISENGANKCARFGANKTKGKATTPALAGLEGDAILTFKAAPWSDEGGKMTVSISNGTIENSKFDLSNQMFTEYSVKIRGGATSKITFTSENNRFFLDEVKVVAIVKEPIIVKEPTATLGFTAAEINEMPWLAANDKVLTEEATEVKDASCVKLTCEEGAQIEYTLVSAETGSSTATVESGAEIVGLIKGEVYELTVCAVKGGYKSASRQYTFTITGSTSSVSSMSAEGVKVFAAEGGVKVVAAEATDVAVYTVAGQLVRQARVAEGSTLVNVAPGFYVVRANGTATKVIVR
uniref:chitobiase/beta-hexosaminidase C-terminal domain-containing protein n=1 Tax=Candidatus Limisoma sp. TaxID=3076476 RepID=UPI003FEEECC2